MRHFSPVLLAEELLDARGQLWIGIALREDRLREQKAEKECQLHRELAAAGTAKRTQLCVALQSLSNPARSCVSSLRSAGSFIVTSARSESIPSITT